MGKDIIGTRGATFAHIYGLWNKLPEEVMEAGTMTIFIKICTGIWVERFRETWAGRRPNGTSLDEHLGRQG